ncbi:hypothetical protein P5673_014980 [Acropora cervicornis]|uniref:Uncharacterized protein n=1 Tax=Acropora cervicornis TaxID=6130 RepID=A0AAD9V5P8_ACRCE|nr:hypothetical protein P5673_014980 [Acropora cervicornis]
MECCHSSTYYGNNVQHDHLAVYLNNINISSAIPVQFLPNIKNCMSQESTSFDLSAMLHWPSIFQANCSSKVDKWS